MYWRVDMDDQRYEEELTKVSQLASLKQEIDSKNQQLAEMEQKLDDASAVARKLVIGLMEKLMKSDRRSLEFEHMYYEYEKMYRERSATVEQLMNEKRKLKEEYIEGMFASNCWSLEILICKVLFIIPSILESDSSNAALWSYIFLD